MPVELGVSLGMAGMPLADQLAVAAAVERAGAGSVASLEAGYDVFAVLAGLASVTTSARVVAGVATWVRPPVATARAAATVDELSGGRLVLGLGSMPPAWSRDHFGIEADRPLARMREYVTVVRGALASADRPLCHEGTYFQVRGYRLPQRPPRAHVPVHLGVTRPAAARFAGEVADGVLVNFVCTRSWLTEVVLPAVAEGERRAGRRVERTLTLCCAVHDDARRAERWLRTSLRGHLTVPYLHDVAAHEGFDLGETVRLASAGRTDEALAAVPGELVARIGVCGDVATVVAELDRLAGHVDRVELMPPRHLHGADLASAVSGIVDVVRAARA